MTLLAWIGVIGLCLLLWRGRGHVKTPPPMRRGDDDMDDLVIMDMTSDGEFDGKIGPGGDAP